MNKKILLWLIIIGIGLVIMIIDYTNYDINKSSLEHTTKEILNNITLPEEANYAIEDKYEKGRILFYSGQVFNEEKKGSFIVGYRKHWLLKKYSKVNYRLNYTNSYIAKHGVEVDTIYFKYVAYQKDESHGLIVEKSVNTKTIFQFCINLCAVILGIYIGKSKIKSA